MTLIGSYNLKSFDDKNFIIEWFEGNAHYSIMTPNLIKIIQDLIKDNIEKRKHFASIFKLIFKGNEKDFLAHPDHIILSYLHEDDKLIAKGASKEALIKITIERLLKAYNTWQSVSLRYEDVKSFCI